MISQAQKLGATGFILVHYDISCSWVLDADELKITEELRRLGEDFGTYLFHHLVVSPNHYGEVAV